MSVLDPGSFHRCKVAVRPLESLAAGDSFDLLCQWCIGSRTHTRQICGTRMRCQQPLKSFANAGMQQQQHRAVCQAQAQALCTAENQWMSDPTSTWAPSGTIPCASSLWWAGRLRVSGSFAVRGSRPTVPRCTANLLGNLHLLDRCKNGPLCSGLGLSCS